MNIISVQNSWISLNDAAWKVVFDIQISVWLGKPNTESQDNKVVEVGKGPLEVLWSNPLSSSKDT